MVKLTYNKQTREYNPKMDVQTFMEANEYNIAQDYQKSEPMEAYKINDGDTEAMRERAQENVENYKEVMVELYADFLSVDDIITEGQRERVAAMD